MKQKYIQSRFGDIYYTAPMYSELLADEWLQKINKANRNEFTTVNRSMLSDLACGMSFSEAKGKYGVDELRELLVYAEEHGFSGSTIRLLKAIIGCEK